MKRKASTVFATAKGGPVAKRERSSSASGSAQASGDSERLMIYTDGSDFKHAINRVIGGGAVFVHRGVVATKGWTFDRKEILEQFKLGDDFSGSFSNPTAEMLAAANALRIAVEMKSRLNVSSALLLADYNQVSLYANKKYQRPKFLPAKRATFIYQKAVCLFLDALADTNKVGLKVEVRHIPGHSGIKYNDMADAIAKKGAAAPDTIAEFFKN